jgi:hypothetical protein
VQTGLSWFTWRWTRGGVAPHQAQLRACLHSQSICMQALLLLQLLLGVGRLAQITTVFEFPDFTCARELHHSLGMGWFKTACFQFPPQGPLKCSCLQLGQRTHYNCLCTEAGNLRQTAQHGLGHLEQHMDAKPNCAAPLKLRVWFPAHGLPTVRPTPVPQLPPANFRIRPVTRARQTRYARRG